MNAATPAEYGAAYLDEHRPGWADHVSVETLDMSCRWNCIWGQLESKPHKSGFSIMHDRHGDEFMARLGFDASPDADVDVNAEFAALDAEWSCLIIERQLKSQNTAMTNPQEVTA